MNINFSQLLTPGQEVIYANGMPYLIGKPYNNAVVEDDKIKITFQPTGIAHLELKSWDKMTPQQKYIEGNNFINSLFKGRLAVSKREDKDGTYYFGYIQADCKVKTKSKMFVRSINVDNGYFVYKDGTTEHQGIDFYIEEKPVKK